MPPPQERGEFNYGHNGGALRRRHLLGYGHIGEQHHHLLLHLTSRLASLLKKREPSGWIID